MASMPNAMYIPAQSFQDRFTAAKKALSVPNSLTYLYFPELDQFAHRYGSNSKQWLNVIEELDAELVKFARSIPSSAGVILTADHGVIDVEPARHIYLDEYECFSDLEQIGGDPRVSFLYFQEGTNLATKLVEITEAIGNICDVVTIADLVAAGWLLNLSEQAKRVAPDLLLLPKADRVAYHRDFAKARSLLMIGQHGGMTQAEWEVPLIVF
jgi:hypothetical protein